MLTCAVKSEVLTNVFFERIKIQNIVYAISFLDIDDTHFTVGVVTICDICFQYGRQCVFYVFCSIRDIYSCTRIVHITRFRVVRHFPVYVKITLHCRVIRLTGKFYCKVMIFIAERIIRIVFITGFPAHDNSKCIAAYIAESPVPTTAVFFLFRYLPYYICYDIRKFCDRYRLAFDLYKIG